MRVDGILRHQDHGGDTTGASAMETILTGQTKMKKYVIKTAEGYLATQGDTHWYEDTVCGWVPVSDDLKWLEWTGEYFCKIPFEIVPA